MAGLDREELERLVRENAALQAKVAELEERASKDWKLEAERYAQKADHWERLYKELEHDHNRLCRDFDALQGRIGRG